MMIRFDSRVAVVTGAGRGLGRSHALALAGRGAKVVVCDLGKDAEAVAEEIRAAGGEALARSLDVTDSEAVESMVAAVVERWGRVDILVNNAGILRDKSFGKMSLEDFRVILDVHLMGSVHCIRAVWPHMRERNFGRIVLTTSSSGLFGNFGQANYAAAKAAVVGLMHALALEGTRIGICVNCLAPTAATQMTEALLSEDLLVRLRPEAVTPGLIALVSDKAPSRVILCAGAGSFEVAHMTMTRGLYLGTGVDAAEQILARLPEITDRAGDMVPTDARDQGHWEVEKALAGESIHA
jgi:NAD(P)-dependent dehydrogenase (short-subunit alcohol dehydrogenase family)